MSDAADADNILHDYGYAIHDNITRGFGGPSAGGLSEGFGDYLSATITDGAWVETGTRRAALLPVCARPITSDAIPATMWGDSGVSSWFTRTE